MATDTAVTNANTQVDRLFDGVCVATFFVCLAVLIGGWLLGLEFLTNLVPGWPTMKPISAISCMLLSAALFTSNRANYKVFSYALVCVLAPLVFFTTLDALFATQLIAVGDRFLALPSDATAICLLLLSVAVLGVHFERGWLAGLLAWASLTLVIFRLFRLAIEGPLASTTSIFDSMAVHTALVVLALSIFGVLLHPRLTYHEVVLARDSMGTFARWGTFLILGLPITLMVVLLSYAESADTNLEDMLAVSVTLMSIFFVVMFYRMLEQLRANAARTAALVSQLGSMMEVSPNGILLVNQQGHIQQSNAMISEMFGYSTEELDQRNVDELLPQNLQLLHGELRLKYFSDPLKRAMGVGKTLQACRKDGSLFSVEIGLAPLQFENEEFVMAVVTDVTLQKNLEAEQKQLNQQILESNEQLKRFAYAASHDLQAPLRRVAGFIQLLQSNYQGRLDTEADAWIDRAVSNLERMQDMIRGLLRMSTIQAEKEEHHFVSLQEVLDQVLELQAINLASVAVQLGQDFPAVTGDQAQLLLLFENLVGNAAKYVSEQPKIDIFLSEDNETSCVVAVKDNGIGIDPKNHQEIFAMFKRLHSYREYEGHGLGLALCKTIVDKHRGEIWCESALGEGSTFFVRLPK